MFVDRFHEQTFDLRQVKNLFGKGIKLGFGQSFCLRCDALNRRATGDKVVRPFAPISFFVVGGTVFEALDFVPLLYKLLINFFFLGIQLSKGFLFWHAEIYVDRIADMRVNDMNAVLEAVRQMALMKNGGEENDLHLRTLEVAQIREDEYFGSLIADDLKGILRDIRNEHRPDTMTADETSLVATVQGQLQDAMNFEGSSEEKQVRSFLATFGIDYDKLSKEQFVTLIEILKLSKYMKSPISQRGKARSQMAHGKGKRKRK